MNTNLKTKKKLFGCLLLAAFILAPVLGANAQNEDDEFGVWTTLEASKKINKKLTPILRSSRPTIPSYKLNVAVVSAETISI